MHYVVFIYFNCKKMYTVDVCKLITVPSPPSIVDNIKKLISSSAGKRIGPLRIRVNCLGRPEVASIIHRMIRKRH